MKVNVSRDFGSGHCEGKGRMEEGEVGGEVEEVEEGVNSLLQ